ncbi:uncharacterized protein F4822DRAFT_425084 [Hypoxylon trugodes]|uniref:uncharacterized protein n=1 Tax=Hypoxylon trugodes TaxID=326681 RepID=UPI00219FD8B7|nr:uncharacterized protein F4822DRAFT_425084 [Hypoxylon trugodes]KAI1391862.1 hypothetical protein F4822DRAFT_425084 [Hypoxylon trugodes]
MTCKRKRSETDLASRSTASKRSRHTESHDLLSPLSDELLIRILTFLPLPDLLNTAPVSRRFYDLSGDSQIWKHLYYSRFVLPRALRIPGFRDGSTREGKLHYSSRKAIWVDGRRGGWVDMHVGDLDDRSRNWKQQYKLRHNWSKGKCAVEELSLGKEGSLSETSPSYKMLVKVSEGVAVTADVATGLRAWNLKTKQLLAQITLGETESDVAPSCMAVDDQRLGDQILEIAIGFTDGSFGVWRLGIREAGILRRYRHEKSSNGELVGIAFCYPYLLTATKSVLLSLYTFDIPPKTNRPITPESDVESVLDSKNERIRNQKDWPIFKDPKPRKQDNTNHISLRSPYLLTSLKSHTSKAPLALSIRKMAGGIVASIAYTFSTMRGWCVGIQDLHIHSPTPESKSAPDITATRLAYTRPIRTPYISSSFNNLDPLSEFRGDNMDGPISLSYTHPYLLVTLPDNTLILYLCTSNATSLSISSGTRLFGHTSGISDAEITARGKAVSVSRYGEEIRVWELEGRAHGESIEVRPTMKPSLSEGGPETFAHNYLGAVLRDDSRNWVGFDDEMVIVLKGLQGRESLMVYDFT